MLSQSLEGRQARRHDVHDFDLALQPWRTAPFRSLQRGNLSQR